MTLFFEKIPKITNDEVENFCMCRIKRRKIFKYSGKENRINKLEKLDTHKLYKNLKM